jgi:lipoyl synthase
MLKTPFCSLWLLPVVAVICRAVLRLISDDLAGGQNDWSHRRMSASSRLRSQARDLRVRVLGSVPYQEALVLQHSLAYGTTDNYLLVLEHPHVYTVGRHADRSHILTEPELVGAVLEQTDRGGDVTYHGPGQLVGYAIVGLDDELAAGPAHIGVLEDIVIATLQDVGLRGASRLDGLRGVWVDAESSAPRKIAAVGVRVIRGVAGQRRTLHGVALNVDCDLAMFEHIIPCGIADRGVTSLSAEGFDVPKEEVMEAFVARATSAFGGGISDRQDVARRATRKLAGASDSMEGPALQPSSRSTMGSDANVTVTRRKPEWLRVPMHVSDKYASLAKTVNHLKLATVCEEAGCPNIYECWSEGTATFMINGSQCTRACGFCQVDTARPAPLSQDEPERVAQAVERMRLEHAVVTCVARDDLRDGGAGAIALTISAIRQRTPKTAIEVLISDCRGDPASLEQIFSARPDVLNHNVETVPRLQRAVRPSAGYARSLSVLARAGQSGLTTKSGLMVGLGEREDELVSTLADLRSIGVSIVTIGQYLRPTSDHLPISRYWTPEEFERLRRIGLELGLTHVEASPLTRSSYHARGAAASVANHRVGSE